MICCWSRFLIVGILVTTVNSLSTGMLKDNSKADQTVRPRAKRAEEILMFGNQQNRRIENTPASSKAFQSTAEKRTLGTSGLEDVKAALSDDEAFIAPKQSSNTAMNNENRLLPYEQNYLYGKVMVNEASEDMPRTWELPPYPRYYNFGEDRRKRSDTKASVSHASTPLSTISPVTTTALPSPATQATSRPIIPVKRSLPVYPELRYKRALDREDLLALLSFLESTPRRSWRNYGNDEYENSEDDNGVTGLEDEDPRAGTAWLEGPVYPRHYGLSPDVAPSDLGIPRTHPVSSYEQYGNQYGVPYESAQYGAAQYGSLYPQHVYYQPEKRFMISRKRSQGYDSYSGRNLNDLVNFSQMMNSQPQGYPNYPQRMLY